MARRLLVVDDDRQMGEMLVDSFSAGGYEVSFAQDAAAALQCMREAPPELLLTDLRIGSDDGLQLCRQALDIVPELPVIVMTGFGSLEAAVGAIRAGAYDFVKKPVDLDALDLMVQRAFRHLDLIRELDSLRAALPPSAARTLVGESPKMERVRDLLGRLADTDTTVLITGESGTGKELAARALHQGSGRAAKPFVAVNCAALPANLLESELFGHAKGAFTGANAAREGLFVQADGGTLFLDEIGEMPMDMQTKLLRALQERSVRPVGSDQSRSFDTRIVAATNRDLADEVEAGRFREDLLYRINVVNVRMPPLRARAGDVLLLAHNFLSQFAQSKGRSVLGISEPAARKLLDYDWPGNVRELRNAMERAVALTRFEEIALEDLPDRIREHESTHLAAFEAHAEDLPTIEVLEARYIRHVLGLVDGNKSKAAEILGLGRSTLYRRLERLEEDS